MAKNKKNTKGLEKRNEKINAWFDYFSDNIQTYTNNIEFVEGSQWNPDEVAYYAANGKTLLTDNVLNKFVKQIIGEQLKTTPEMQVVVDSDQVNQKKVAIRSDLLRTIQIKNHAKECYEIAIECSMKGGFGALWAYNDYDDGITFQQVVKQEPIKNPTLCFWDPKAKNKTKCDGDYCGMIDYMRKSEFKRKHPNAEPTSEGWNSDQVDLDRIMLEEDDELIPIATIYEKRFFKKRILLVKPTISGKEFDTVPADQFDEYKQQYLNNIQYINEILGMSQSLQEPQVIDERIVDDYKIKCYRQTKVEDLEEYEFPARDLPIQYVDGYSYYDKGKQTIKSFTQDAHDAQKLVNYIYSEIGQAVRTYQRVTIIGTQKMFNGALKQMKNPEKPTAFLPIEPDPAFNGGVPMITDPHPVPAELFTAYQMAVASIQDILGRTEASMGDPGNEISGVAIENRIMQQNTVVNKWFDGLLKAIEQQGRVVNQLISNLYDQPRSMMLYKENNKAYNANLNQFNHQTGEVDNEITNEDFEIRISVGANYEMMRQQERQYLLDILQQSQLPAFAKIGHLIAKLSDTPIMPQVVQAIETMIDPQVLAKEKGLPPPPPPPPPPQVMLEQQKIQADMQATQVKVMQAQIDKMKAQMEFLMSISELQGKGVEAQAEVQKAAMEAGRDLSQHHVDMVGHGVETLGHLKDLAALSQQPSTQQELNAGAQT
jgi:hypothetical protein